MRICLQLGGPLRDVAAGRSEIVLDLPSGSVDALKERLGEDFPGLAELVFGPHGEVRRYISVYVNGVGLPQARLPEQLRVDDVVRFTLLVSGG